MELISSRNMVPLEVLSNSPALFTDPVKAPLEVPNKIPSSRFSGMAAQFTGVNLLLLRGL